MIEENSTVWRDELISQPDDTLLGCLTILSKMLTRPHRRESLITGLPLVDNKLTPGLFHRAAARAGLSSKIVKRKLAKINALVMPTILLLNDSNACILVSYEEDKATVVFPESGNGESTIKLDELEEQYSGYAIFIKAVHQFDKRASELVKLEHSNWFWGTIARFWPVYIEVFIASILVNSFALASPLFVMNVYDRVVPNHAVETLWVLALGVSIVFLFDFLLRSIRGYFVDAAGKKADIILSATIFEKILNIKMSSRSTSVGSFANRLQEFEAFRDFFTSATIMAIIDLPFTLLFIFVIWTLAGELAYIPLIAIPLVIMVSLLIQIPLKKNITELFKYGSQKGATLIESLTGLETIKSLGAESQIQGKWEQITGFIAQYSQKVRFFSTLMVNFSTFSQQLATVAVVVGGVYLITDGVITMGALIACSILTGRALAPLSQLVGVLSRFHQSKSSLSSVNEMMNLPIERPNDKAFLNRPKFRGGIEFKKVTFRYPGQEINALEDISFKINPGEKVALIGRIGSGKSSIEKLIMGLYEADEGSILIDSTDIRQVDPADLRRHIGYVAQDVTLFYGSVRDNIVMSYPYAEDNLVIKAAKISGVTDFVNRHPAGFDMPVGERGEFLSGGQRQSIAIARALLMSPSVLILDEPTNAMDNASEELFKKKLMESLTSKHTLLLVTQKSSVLSLVDRVIVIDNSRIVADGAREQIVSALKKGQIKVSVAK